MGVFVKPGEKVKKLRARLASFFAGAVVVYGGGVIALSITRIDDFWSLSPFVVPLLAVVWAASIVCIGIGVLLCLYAFAGNEHLDDED